MKACPGTRCRAKGMAALLALAVGALGCGTEPGTPGADSGVPANDDASEWRDAGGGALSDARVLEPDAAVPDDAGAGGPSDSGVEPSDVGFVQPDGGPLTPPDGGTLTPPDGGSLTPPDGGSLTSPDGGGLTSLDAGLAPDAGPLTLEITSAAPTTAAEGVAYSYTVTCVPAGVATVGRASTDTCGGNVDAGATYGFTPTEAQGGSSCTVAVTCSDGTSTVVQTTAVAVVEVDSPPLLTNLPHSVSTVHGHQGSYELTATDPDLPSQLLVYSLGTTTCDFTPTLSEARIDWTCGQTIGECAVEVFVTDPTGLQDTMPLTLSCTNQAPRFETLGTTTAAEGTVYTYDFTCADGDGDAVALSKTPADTCGGTVSGSTYSFTATEVQGGTSCTFGLRCTDGLDEATQTTTVHVAETNQAPVLTNLPASRSTLHGRTGTFDALATDPDLPAQGLTFSLGATTCSFAVAVSPEGQVSWECGTTLGTCQADVRVSDGSLLDTRQLAISCTNSPPRFTSEPPSTATETEDLIQLVSCVDDDGDALGLSIAPADTCGGTLTQGASGTGSYVVDGSLLFGGDSCVVALRCGDGAATASQEATVSIGEKWLALGMEPIRIHAFTADLATQIPTQATLVQALVDELVLYYGERLAVHRLASNLVVSAGSCASLGVTAPSGHTSTGVAGTDYVLYVTATDQNCSSPSTLVWGGFCQLDPQGRPLVGVVNVCKSKIDPQIATDADERAALASRLRHETLHALGFNNLRFQSTPSGSILTTFTERGHQVTKVTSRKTLQKARGYLGCSTLNGAELEDGGGAAIQGQHLEGRLFSGDLMAAALCDEPPCPMSAVTMAILQDTGWYRANFGLSGTLWHMKDMGCVFATASCSSWYPSGSFGPLFCEQDTTGCNPGRSHVSTCSYATYTTALPTFFQYFADPRLGGADLYADYCPRFLAYSNLRCKDPTDATTVTALQGATFGAASVCLESSLFASGWSGSPPNGSCYQLQGCVYTGRSASSYEVVVPAQGGGPSLVGTCTTGGQQLSFGGYTGALTCAPPRDVCPDLP